MIQLLDTIGKKQGDEDIVEAYRSSCGEAQNFLDSVVRELEGVEKGRGLPLEGRINTLKSILEKHEAKKSATLPKIKTLMDQVIDIVSNLDAQQVEEQVK